MTEKQLVSIIIPSYNAAGYIKEAVDSALAQTYENIEIIVVDDGSTDNTKEILAPYIKKRQIKYFYQKNQGLSAARNVAIKNSKGEYIALLDADDIFLPAKIEKQISYLENNHQCDVCYCGLYHFFDGVPDKLLKLDYRYYSGVDVLPQLLERHFIAPLAAVLRRSVFDRFGYFDENLKRSEDLEFWLRLAYGGVQICFFPEILAKLRIRTKNNLQSFDSQPEVKLTNLKVIERLNQKMTLVERRRYKMNFHLMRYRFKTAVAYLLTGNKSEARTFLFQSLNYYFLGSLIAAIIWMLVMLLPGAFWKYFFRHLYTFKSTIRFQKI